MVFPFHFGPAFPALAPLREAADLLARFDEWDEDLYDESVLATNDVPVYAAAYVLDMYVDIEFSRETASLVRGTKVFETNVLYHNAVRAHADEVVAQLFRLREDTVD
jgi:hypothetical protein